MKTMPLCFILAVVMLILSSSLSIFAEDEKVTITTYYPSPYGVYGTLRLYPKATPADGQTGEMYYDQGKNRVRMFVSQTQKNWLLSESFNVVPVSCPAQGEVNGQVCYDTAAGQLRIWIDPGWRDLIQTVYIPITGGNPVSGGVPFNGGYILSGTGTTGSSPALQMPGPVTMTPEQLQLYRNALVESQARNNELLTSSANPATASSNAALLSTLNANSNQKIQQVDNWIAQGGVTVSSPASGSPTSGRTAQTTTSKSSLSGAAGSSGSSASAGGGASSTPKPATSSAGSGGMPAKTSTTAFF